jgi:hypothetical protein
MILTDCTSSNQLIGIAKEHIYILSIERKRTICVVRYASKTTKNCHLIRPPID